MEKLQLVNTTKPEIQVHTMFRGDAERSNKTLTKKKIAGVILNDNIPVRMEYIDINQLVPLETQRETKESWTTGRLKDLGGFDVLAAGALMVAYDQRDNTHYVFDGCGRLAQAQVNQAPNKLLCLVYEIPKERAAFYFAYNQDRGRRNLSKEIIFVNAVYSGEPEALMWCERLEAIECYIKGQTDYAVPHPQPINQPEIKYRALVEGFKLSGGDISLMKQVRDMIWTAWAQTAEGCPQVRQDLFLGLIAFMRIYPDARKNGLNKAIQQYINWVAQGTRQAKVEWKQIGGNQHNKEALSVAFGFQQEFRRSQMWKPSFAQHIIVDRFNDFNFEVNDSEE